MSRTETHPRDAVMSVIAGAIVGVMAVVTLTSYAALIFSGDLVRFVPQGISIALLAGTVMALVGALSSSYNCLGTLAKTSARAISAATTLNTAALGPLKQRRIVSLMSTDDHKQRLEAHCLRYRFR